MRTRQSIIVIASVLTLALAAALVLCASARATFPGRNGLITFCAPAHSWSTSEIYVMNPDGSGQKQITHGSGKYEAFMPSVSPDGKTIVFDMVSDTTSEICSMATTGADQRLLATGLLIMPCYSPNGKQVVFAGLSRDQAFSSIWVMRASGSHQRRLTAVQPDYSEVFPTYSPNGKTIVFVEDASADSSGKIRGQILAMNADGTHLRRLAYTAPFGNIPNYPGLGVSFSPDGKSIVYDAWATRTQTVVRIMNADGTHQRVLPHSYGFSFPCYSPDGRQILCVNGHDQISVASVNGTHWRQLTHITDGVGWRPNWGPHVR